MLAHHHNYVHEHLGRRQSTYERVRTGVDPNNYPYKILLVMFPPTLALSAAQFRLQEIGRLIRTRLEIAMIVLNLSMDGGR